MKRQREKHGDVKRIQVEAELIEMLREKLGVPAPARTLVDAALRRFLGIKMEPKK